LRKIAICLCIFLLASTQIRPSDPQSNRKIFDSIIAYASVQNLSGQSTGIVLTAIGKYFLSTPYIEKSLDRNNEEKLTVELTGFDCTTFVESSLALARCISSSKTTYTDFENELTQIRYRGGKLNSYISRLHYFSEWIIDNTAKGIIKDVTQECGGNATTYKLNFMSTHTQFYPQLKTNPDYIDSIRAVEKKISGKIFYELPKSLIQVNEEKIHSGDIIVIATDIAGLDVSHVGIAVIGKNNRVYLLHASSSDKRVKISETPLDSYLAKHNHDTGIIVLRPQAVQ
jgi:hypothetical protein